MSVERENNSNNESTFPSTKTLQYAAKFAIEDDKKIMLDYWRESLPFMNENGGTVQGHVLIGIRDNGEKLLVKSEDEYTSPINKVFKVENDLIIITDNSIYITSKDIPTNSIS